MTLQKSSKFFELYSILNDIFNHDKSVSSPDRDVILQLIYEHLCSDWASKVLFDNYQESLIETIKKYVKNDSNLTELDEQMFISKAKISSKIGNI